MTYNQTVNFTPYDEQMAELQRRQRMAELMQQQAIAPLETPQSGGRIIAKVSPVAGLAKMLQAYMAGKEQRDIGQQQKELARSDFQNAMDFYNKINTPRQVYAEGQAVGLTPQQASVINLPTTVQQPGATLTEQQSAILNQPMQPEQREARTANIPYSQREIQSMALPFAMSGGPRSQMMAQALMNQKQPSIWDYVEKPKIGEGGIDPTSLANLESDVAAGRTPRASAIKLQPKQEKLPLTQLEQLHQYRDRLSSANPNDPRIQDVNDEIRKIKTSGPATVVNVDTKAGNEIIKPFIDKIAEGYQSATASKDVLAQIDSLESLTKSGTFTGAMAPKAIGAAQFLESFGIKVDPKTLANSRAFEAQTKKLVLDFMNASGGARGFAREETEMLMDAFPKIVDSPEARQQILDTLRRKSLREIQNYNNNVGRFKNAYPNAVIPFDPIETEEDQYQRWKQSRGGK